VINSRIIKPMGFDWFEQLENAEGIDEASFRAASNHPSSRNGQFDRVCPYSTSYARAR
jgi:hypothetical protein